MFWVVHHTQRSQVECHKMQQLTLDHSCRTVLAWLADAPHGLGTGLWMGLVHHESIGVHHKGTPLAMYVARPCDLVHPIPPELLIEEGHLRAVHQPPGLIAPLVFHMVGGGGLGPPVHTDEFS